VGAQRWDVYPGAATGFAQSPKPFAIPPARCQVKFDQLAELYTPVRYSLLELTGDALPDLVVHADTCDTAVGASRWDVYPASASGFAQAPVAFAIPAARCQVTFDEASEASGSLKYALLDLTADARADLVVYDDSCDAAIGSQRWDVYPSSASGFAAGPSPFSLPAPRCQAPFDALAEVYGPVEWGLIDLSCDGYPDLVVTADDCDTAVGLSRWDVYLGGASGFGAAPQSLGVPAPRCQAKFDSMSDVYGGAPYALLSLGKPVRPSLVVYDDDCDAQVGLGRWDAYRLE
jgi:hypothetical protein